MFFKRLQCYIEFWLRIHVKHEHDTERWILPTLGELSKERQKYWKTNCQQANEAFAGILIC